MTQAPWRLVCKPLYNLVISVELAIARQLASGSPRASTADWVGDITAVVKSFERPDCLQRLLGSMRHAYPQLQIIVVDDSRKAPEAPGAELVRLPFDSGVSRGRAEGVLRVKTPYTLMLDDDFIFHRGTRLDIAHETLQRSPEVDLLAGRQLDLPWWRHKARPGAQWPGSLPPLVSIGSKIDGLPVVSKTPNFYLARTEKLRAVGWDVNIRRIDHAEFFARAVGRMVCVQDHRWSVLHAKTPFDEAYMQQRMDIAADREYIRSKWAGKEVIGRSESSGRT